MHPRANLLASPDSCNPLLTLVFGFFGAVAALHRAATTAAKDPTDAPLLHDAEDVPAPVYEVESAAAGGYQSGATGGYQQDSKVPF